MLKLAFDSHHVASSIERVDFAFLKQLQLKFSNQFLKFYNKNRKERGKKKILISKIISLKQSLFENVLVSNQIFINNLNLPNCAT